MVKGVINRVIRSYLPIALALMTNASALAQGAAYSKKSSKEAPVIQVYDVSDMPFSSQTNTISVSGLEKRLCNEGIDGEVLEGEVLDNANINYSGFREKVFADALREGYTTNQIASLTPIESITLSTRLTSKNLNYIGKTNPLGELISETEKKIEAAKDLELRNQLSDLLLVIKKDMPLLKEGEIMGIDVASNGKGYDSKSIQQRYVLGDEVVCQGFSRANVQIFNTLKSINPNLANTYLSGFVCPEQKHMWNQVTSVQKDNDGRISYAVGFVEPQAKDKKNINAIDTDLHLSKEQYKSYINKFYNQTK